MKSIKLLFIGAVLCLLAIAACQLGEEPDSEKAGEVIAPEQANQKITVQRLKEIVIEQFQPTQVSEIAGSPTFGAFTAVPEIGACWYLTTPPKLPRSKTRLPSAKPKRAMSLCPI